ncbi:MAG: hypothetical protein E7568_07025 [Ruminococcaceae bacterium]|nr:hypothetical protein [Oscillospiraceae bacterium]
MEIKTLGKIINGQDGAIFGGYLFRLSEKGNCTAYNIKDLSGNPSPLAEFNLDKRDLIVPHCNSVCFGNEYYDKNDEFPLLYANIYNNYASKENKLKGVTCVYRLERKENDFTTTLVQIIEVGFTEDSIWKSEDINDKRPYGNSAVDSDSSTFYAFTMRDGEKNTRYFAFDLPKLCDGVFDDKYGVNRVVLKKKDIQHYFDCEYHNFMQGACIHKGVLYSVEGFTHFESAPPVIRLIDLKERKQKSAFNFEDFGLYIEPELVDFDGDTCYYSDDVGNMYTLSF